MNSMYRVSVLMDKDGKYVTIRNCLKELKLCAVERQQGNEPSLKIQRREEGQKKLMAFVFRRGRHSYLPKVADGKLKIEEVTEDDYEKLADNFWFEKKNLGNNEHYCLQSVVESRPYLTANQFIFTLSTSNYTSVTDEYVE